MEALSETKSWERIQQLETAFQDDPTDEFHVLELGRSYVASNRFSEAVVVLERLKSLNPNSVELYPLLGLSYLNCDRAHEAIDQFKMAMLHKPEASNLLWCMGEALFKAERYLQAVEYFKRSAELERGNLLPLRKMAQAFFDMGKMELAIEILNEAIKYDGSVSELWSSLGWAYLHIAEYTLAIGPLKKSLELNQNNIQCVKSLALSLFALGRKDSSLEYYQLALALDPQDAEALFGLGILYVSSGNLKCAHRQYEALVASKSHLAEDLYAKILERNEILMA